MNENKQKFLQELIRLMPMTGKSITEYEREIGLGNSRLYNIRRGYLTTEEQYNHILDFMLTNYRYELAQIMAVLMVNEKDIYNLENTIEKYFETLENESVR